MTHADKTQTDIRGELDDVLLILRDARRLLEAGALVDISGIEARVERTCRRLAEMEPAEAAAFLPDLTAVAEELAALESECVARREALGPAPEGLPAADLSRAFKAYARPRDEDT